MSSGAGEGTGASLQDKETDILRRDDAETIAETLEEVSRMVIEWYFGNGVEPLARVELIVPVQEDATSVVTAASALADRGAKVSASALMDRLNLPKAADEGEALLPSGQNLKSQISIFKEKEEVENSKLETLNPNEEKMQGLRNALAEDLRPLGDALFAAANAGDGAAVRAAVRKISDRMPEFMEIDALAALIEGGMLDDLNFKPQNSNAKEEVENAGNSEGARKGWETRRRNGWKPANRPPGTGSPMKRREVESIELVLDAAFVSTDSRDYAVYEKIAPATAAKIKAATGGTGPDVDGWERIVEADKVNKILPKHGTDRWPVEEEDFRRLPELLADPESQT